MSALAEALIAAQAKALAAIEKAYVRGTIDVDRFYVECAAIGCTDAVDLTFLLGALDTLKEHGASEPAYSERRTSEKPTGAQVAYIAKLAKEREIEPPDMAGVTREQASEIITTMQNGNYDAARWNQPF